MRVEKNAKAWTLSVQDQGSGIDELQLEQVLKPFSRGDNPTTQGTGLGLAIAASAAEQLGGKLLLKNVQPTGLQFIYEEAL